MKAGIMYVCDLFDINGEALPFSQCVVKGINKQRWLAWSSLIKSIRTSKKHQNPKVQNVNAKATVDLNIAGKSVHTVKSKQIYSHILKHHYDDNLEVPNIVKYINENYDANWKEVYSYLYSCTYSTKLHEFQFKFFHDILVNQFWLCKWGLADSELYTL